MAKIRRNLTSKKFGKLTAIEYMGTDKFRNALWKCQCDCGNIIIEKGTLLTNGKVVSCGECENKYNFEDPVKIKIDTSIVGKRYGRLLVLEENDKKIINDNGEEENIVMCKCRCDCGSIIEVQKSRLINGYSKSCGCLHKEKISNNLFRLKVDRIGTKYEKLTILSYDTEKKMWKCQCDCGNITYVKHFNGNTKSCGCLRKEKRKKGENNIE